MSETYTPDNLLDRLSDPATLAEQYERGKRRERELLDRHLGLGGGDALSVGCGWHPGRHLLPKPAWRLVAADLDPERPRHAVAQGEADEGLQGAAGQLDVLPDASFDVVLHRLVLHHVAYARAARAVLAEARRLLRPGGALVAIEPNLCTRSAPRWRSPTAPGSACACTAPPTTSRCRRAGWRRPRAPPA